jgi:hypothetical protein
MKEGRKVAPQRPKKMAVATAMTLGEKIKEKIIHKRMLRAMPNRVTKTVLSPWSIVPPLMPFS